MKLSARPKQNTEDVERRKTTSFQHSGPSLSMITPSTDNDDDDECDEQGATSTATPVPPEVEHVVHLPESIHPTSYSISSSSSSLSSLSSSATPPPSVPLVSNTEAPVGYGTPQVKDRIRDLKTRFLGFRDDLERIIGRLEVLEGVDGGLSDHPQASLQKEDKGKRKAKESDLDIEIMSGSESGGTIPGHVDSGVGVDTNALDAPRGISVQTLNVSSAIPLDSMDDLSNVTKNNLESGKDDGIPSSTQFVNTTSNLSTMVDNLVSIKMLSMMQTLVKSSVGGNSNSNAKLVEPSTITKTTTTTTTESDSELICQPSPSTSSIFISAASHSMDACDSIMSSLLEELRTIKQEARCREQSEKEELSAMRQLHSAEVDALRRRLSYLESRNVNLGTWDMNNGVGGAGLSGRWKDSRVDDSLELDRHHHNRRFFDDSGARHTLRQQRYGDRPQALQQSSLTHHSSRSTSIVNPEGASTSADTTTPPLSLRKPNSLPPPPLSVTSSTAADSMASSSTPSLPTPTPPITSSKPGFSKDNNSHYYGMGTSMDLDDDSMVNLPLTLPLPIKSQRKHHIMALARAHFSS